MHTRGRRRARDVEEPGDIEETLLKSYRIVLSVGVRDPFDVRVVLIISGVVEALPACRR